MDIRELFTDDSAVSPVIGVILMVAITVILAAVIGSFVLNLGGSLQQSSPQVSFGFEYEADGAANDTVEITHETGDSVEAAQLDVTVSSATAISPVPGSGWSGTVSAGSTANWTYDSTWSGETVRVVWNSENGESSATLSTSTAPS